MNKLHFKFKLGNDTQYSLEFQVLKYWYETGILIFLGLNEKSLYKFIIIATD